MCGLLGNSCDGRPHITQPRYYRRYYFSQRLLLWGCFGTKMGGNHSELVKESTVETEYQYFALVGGACLVRCCLFLLFVGRGRRAEIIQVKGHQHFRLLTSYYQRVVIWKVRIDIIEIFSKLNFLRKQQKNVGTILYLHVKLNATCRPY